MQHAGPILNVVMYHYVRDLPRSRFPRIKGMQLDSFRRQVAELSAEFEMATLESAMAFLEGSYRPSRDLCLLTFDDGLQEHWSEATPILAAAGIQGVFSIITSCVEDQVVAPVHMNHFLMASLDFREYRKALFAAVEEEDATLLRGREPDAATVARTYPWDTAEVAAFKYVFNFMLPGPVRDRVVGKLFHRYLGEEAEFAVELYVNWKQVREMQGCGMVIGGHTHAHQALATMSPAEQRADLATCRRLLDENAAPQPIWPFTYPYGKRDSYTPETVATIRRLNFDCGFSTEKGANAPGADRFAIRRFDCKQAPAGHDRRHAA